jgi:transposase InsO family protein
VTTTAPTATASPAVVARVDQSRATEPSTATAEPETDGMSAATPCLEPQITPPAEPAEVASQACRACPAGRPGSILDVDTHLRRLARLREVTTAAARTPREPAWQRPQRELEQQVRAEVAGFVARLRTAGIAAGVAADLLGIPARTLRLWRIRTEAVLRPAPALGRPHVRCVSEEAENVLGFLHSHGPHVGLPSLRASFPRVARAELEDLLRCYRHLWQAAHPRLLCELHWAVPGAVWALDLTEVSPVIDGRYRYVLAVRDLASGMQLSWQPVADLSVAAVLPELTLLFTVYGAPLVLKSDNGSAFRAARYQGLLRRFQVWPLYSPPGKPWYNGAIEASIGSLKTRTQFAALRRGHEEEWTSADLERAREEANTVARPRGPAGLTPAEAWEARRPPISTEREHFGATVRIREEERRRQEGLGREVELDHYEQAGLHRRVLEAALVQHGYLWLTRRRIPQRLFGRKVANFR